MTSWLWWAVMVGMVGSQMVPESYAGAIRIACLGTSITQGAGIVHRERNCYPAQLQAMLGEKYEVRNFGAGGATLLQRGDLPYTLQAGYREALAWAPDLVFMEFGTNDSKPQNRVHLATFEQDYLELIRAFQVSGSDPRIVLLLPPPVFSADTLGITDRVIRDQILPRIRSVAHRAKAEAVNLYNHFLDAGFCFPDGIHPSAIGAGRIAERLYELVTLKTDSTFNLSVSGGLMGSDSTYYGFDCVNFTLDGREARVVKPRRVAEGRPWLWRARFWGHEPQAEIALIERGFHLVYCDVAELFGNDEAVRIWDKFSTKLVRAGLSPRAALEGFSRGGIYMYRWAVSNPGRVACVYADAPVLDLKSWPGGKGKGHGNSIEWERFKTNFGLQSEEEALAFRGNPVDLAGQVAGAGFPMLHVCGEADVTVPIEENTDIFEQRILAAGGRITVIRKPGVGHHPHSLPNPQPIVNFILRATGQKTCLARIPAPGNEYRPWKEGTDWYAVAESLDRLCVDGPAVDVLFLGDSITEGMGGIGRDSSSAPGAAAFARAFRNFTWANLGICGDRTQHVLWRVLHGRWPQLHPDVVVLTIGINNLVTDSGEEVVEGINEITAAIVQRDTSVRVLVVGPLAAGKQGSLLRTEFERVHKGLRRMNAPARVHYNDVAFSMLNPDGSLRVDLYTPDGIHLTPDGYRVLAGLVTRALETPALRR